MNYPPLSISLVTFNSADDLPAFFASLNKQSFTDFELVVVDNASSDGSIELVKNLWPSARCLPQTSNLGYAGGHNVGIEAAHGQYVLLTNVDIVLDPHFLQELITTAESHPESGSFGGKLLKLSALKDGPNSGIIDSTGILAFRNRRFVDRGEGEADQGQYNKEEAVFGLSGALVMYRRSALEAVSYGKGEYFDSRYFMYREDIDLAWRLQRAGWDARYIPSALGFHRRSGSGKEKTGNLEAARRRGQKSALVNFYSYRNHLLTLLKNEALLDFIIDSPWILWYEVRKLGYLLVFERSSLRAWRDIWNIRKQTAARRARGQSIGIRSVRNWFLHSWTSHSSS